MTVHNNNHSSSDPPAGPGGSGLDLTRQVGLDELRAELDRLRDERDRLRAGALRFYRADGSFETLGTPEEVVARRLAAAGDIDRLRSVIVRARLALARGGPPASVAAILREVET